METRTFRALLIATLGLFLIHGSWAQQAGGTGLAEDPPPKKSGKSKSSKRGDAKKKSGASGDNEGATADENPEVGGRGARKSGTGAPKNRGGNASAEAGGRGAGGTGAPKNRGGNASAEAGGRGAGGTGRPPVAGGAASAAGGGGAPMAAGVDGAGAGGGARGAGGGGQAPMAAGVDGAAAGRGGNRRPGGAEGDEANASGNEKPGNDKDDQKSDEKETPASIEWVVNVDDGFTQAKSGKAHIMLFVSSTASDQAKKMEETVFKNKDVVKMVSESYIAIKADLEQNATSLKDFNVPAAPTVLFLHCINKKELARLKGFSDVDLLKAELKKHIIPEGEALESTEDSQKLLSEADTAFEQKKFGKALGLYKQVVSKHKKSPEAVIAGDKVKEIEALAEAKFAEMKAAGNSKLFSLVARLKAEIIDVYGGTPAVAKANEFYNALQAKPDSKLAVRTANAAQDLDKVGSHISQKRYAAAYDLLKKMKRDYTDIKRVQDEVDWHLKTLESNAQVMRSARDELAVGQSKRWLNLARSYSKNGRVEEAEAYYTKIIETFPDTTFSETAQHELEKLRR